MKKSVSLLLGSVITLASMVPLASCGKEEIPDTEDTLQIYCWQGGYGTEWCDALIESFKNQEWVKEKYPNLNILAPTYNDNWGFAASRLSAGDRNTYDLLFSPGLNQYYGPSGYALDLTESVYNSTVPGEDILWKNKENQSYRLSNKYVDVKDVSSERYYCTPWAGGMGAIIYNDTALSGLGIEVPNTTDELVAACAAIMENKNANNGKYNKGFSFIQSKDAPEYFEYLFTIWWAQYEGISGYNDFWSGIDNNRYSANIFLQEGREHALEVFEEILDYDKGYLTPNTFNLEFMPAQLAFLKGEGVFHVNGDWLENEMRDLTKDLKLDTFKTMKTPIISALGEKLGITDAELSAIVDYVDGEGEKPTFTSTADYTEEEVIDIVREARSVVQSVGAGHQAAIPKNATGKNVAVDFLRFMATDIAQEAYMTATGGNNLPFAYNVKEKNPELYNSFSTIHQSRIDYFNNGLYEPYTLPDKNSFPLCSYGDLEAFSDMTLFATFSASGNKKTAADFMKETVDVWTESKWDRALKAAGIT